MLSYSGSGTCGVPMVNHFQCRHMIAVSIAFYLEEQKLVIINLSTAMWKAQYPLNFSYVVPKKAEIYTASNIFNSSFDFSLGFSIAAPTKPCNPRKMRVTSVIENIVRPRIDRNEDR